MWKKLLAVTTLLFFVSLTQNSLLFGTPLDNDKKTTRGAITESFDSGTKNYYPAGSISVSSGNWYVEEGLVGYSDRDKKMGTKAVRLRDAGKLRSDFDFAEGIDVVTVYHGTFGTDAAGRWELYSSSNAGTDWVKVGATVTTSSTFGSTAFAVRVSGNVRLEIRKVDGTESRINIDEISITPYSVPVDPGNTTPTRDNNTSLGNPSGAVYSLVTPNNYLMEKPLYTLSYDNEKGRSNWASWHLSTAWVGTAPRPTDFNADATLPVGWNIVTGTDFSGTGFDRGHICPASDRDFNDAEIAGTFIMTNMMAQAPYNNQQPWRLLEEYCRTLVSAGNELYVIAGPYGQGGIGSLGGVTNTIAGGRVVVPSHTWKIIVVIPNGENDVARVASNTRVIAIWMPNTDTGLTSAWEPWRCSVDFIESQTGYDFLSNISTVIQSVIEAKVDDVPVK